MRTDLFIDRSWCGGGHGPTLPVENPATEEIVMHVAQASTDDARRAISAARHAFDEGPWTRMTPDERHAIMRAFGDAVHARRDEFIELVVAEGGSTISLARTGMGHSGFRRVLRDEECELAGADPSGIAARRTRALRRGPKSNSEQSGHTLYSLLSGE